MTTGTAPSSRPQPAPPRKRLWLLCLSAGLLLAWLLFLLYLAIFG